MTSSHGLEIRAAAATDAPGLATLLAEAGLLVEPRVLAARLAVLRQAGATALVAVQWGPPSGLLVMHWRPTLAAAAPVAQVSMLLVRLEDRRRGIARRLVKAAAQAGRLAGCDELEMPAAADAPSLHGFCRATGFAEAGPRFLRSLRRQG